MHFEEARDTILKKLFDYKRLGVVCDLDGTLAPIVSNPMDATPTEKNVHYLKELNKRLPLVALVSGRAVQNLYDRAGIPELVYSGNHGLERWENGHVIAAPEVEPYVPNIQNAVKQLKEIARDDMLIEDKRVTISVHYRNTPDPVAVKAEFTPKIDAIAQANDLHRFEGRMIFELRPPVEMNKGTIFKHLIEEYGLDAAIFIGDDVTDADALKMARTLREAGTCYALGIGVLSDYTPDLVKESADVLVDGIHGVETLLSFLLSNASKASST